DCAECEVSYYHRGRRSRSVIPGADRRVPSPYGGFIVEWMDSHGGWISTASDLARFAAIYDDPNRSPVLAPDTIAAQLERPSGLAGHDDDGSPKREFYCCGWMKRPGGPGGGSMNHTGALDGTSTLLFHRNDKLNVAVLFNSRFSKDNQEL